MFEEVKMDLFGIKRRAAERDFNRELTLGVQMEMERFASGMAEHIRSYHELSDIAESHVNPDYAKANLQQQSGFSAEVKNVARINAENALSDNPARVARTDNVGSVNHPQYDRVNVDANGKPIRNANGDYVGGVQQKNFCRPENYDKLLTRDYEHYSGVDIEIPTDHYDTVMKRWDGKIANYQKQADHLRQVGNTEKAAEIEARIKKIRDVKARTKPSKVSSSDAMEARLNPLKSVVKDALPVAHKAGLQSAKISSMVGGGVSVCQNLVAVANGDKDFDDAAIDIAKDTGKAAAIAYAMGAGSSLVGGALKATSSEVCKGLARGNGPAVIIQAGTVLCKNTFALIAGKMSAEDYIQKMGKDGCALASSLTGSNLGAVVGTFVAPGVGTIVGGVLGGMVASLMSGAMYDELLKTARDNRLSEEKRKVVMAICADLKHDELAYQAELNACFDVFFSKKEEAIRSSFEEISRLASSGASTSEGLSQLAASLGCDVNFKTQDEFDKFVSSGASLEL